MPRVIPFHKEHLYEIETNFEFPETAKDAIVASADSDSFTLCEEDSVIMCGGVHNIWTGVGEAWLVLSGKAYGMPITVARCTQNVFQTIMENNNLWRIQASVHTGDAQSVRFAEWLGFENEGMMKMFGPDKSDYYRFARVS